MSARESSGANTAVVVPYVRDRAEQATFPRSTSASTGSANDLDDEFDDIPENFGISELIIDLEADIEKQDTTPGAGAATTAAAATATAAATTTTTTTPAANAAPASTTAGSEAANAPTRSSVTRSSESTSPIPETSSDFNGSPANSSNSTSNHSKQRVVDADESVTASTQAHNTSSPSSNTINSTTSNSSNARVSSNSRDKERDRDRGSQQQQQQTTSSSSSNISVAVSKQHCGSSGNSSQHRGRQLSSNQAHSSISAASRSLDVEREDRGLRIKIQKTSKPGKSEHQIVSTDLNSSTTTSSSAVPSTRSAATSAPSSNSNNVNNTNTASTNTSPSHSTNLTNASSSTKECGTSTSSAHSTEPDSVGPCEPGTSVTLEGIVWQETEGGILVVNVTWRGKTYVGTLLDCTKHDWAPQRLCDSPASDIDSKASKSARTKRITTRNNGIGIDESILVQTTGKLRNGKGRRILNPNDMVASSKRRKNAAVSAIKVPDLDSNSEDTNVETAQSSTSNGCNKKSASESGEGDTSGICADLKVGDDEFEIDTPSMINERKDEAMEIMEEPTTNCLDKSNAPLEATERDTLTPPASSGQLRTHRQTNDDVEHLPKPSVTTNMDQCRSVPNDSNSGDYATTTSSGGNNSISNSSGKTVIVEPEKVNLASSSSVSQGKPGKSRHDNDMHHHHHHQSSNISGGVNSINSSNSGSSDRRTSCSNVNSETRESGKKNSHRSSSGSGSATSTEQSNNGNSNIGHTATHDEGMKPSGISTGPPPAPHSANYFLGPLGIHSFNPIDPFGHVKSALVGPYGGAPSPGSLIPRFPVLGGSPPSYGHPLIPPPPMAQPSPLMASLPGQLSYPPHNGPPPQGPTTSPLLNIGQRPVSPSSSRHMRLGAGPSPSSVSSQSQSMQQPSSTGSTSVAIPSMSPVKQQNSAPPPMGVGLNPSRGLGGPPMHPPPQHLSSTASSTTHEDPMRHYRKQYPSYYK